MNTTPFFEFIYDRQAIAVAKKQGKPRPWSHEPVFQKYKFCNVRRKDDATTKHLIESVHEHPKLSPEDVLFNIILFRFFNTRYFYRDVLSKPLKVNTFDYRKTIAEMDEAKKNGFKLFNTAYMICGIPFSKWRKEDKHVQCVLRMREMLRNRKFYVLVAEDNAERFYDKVQFDGKYLVGKFLAYQILLDWNYYTKMNGMSDFVDVGPGAIGGVDFIFGKDRTKSDAEYCKILFQDQEQFFSQLEKETGKHWGEIDGKKIALSDIENCLCEYRKFYKLKNKIKTRIRRYDAV